MNTHLPNWLTRTVGAALFVIGLALTTQSLLLGICVLAGGLSIGLSRKPMPKKKCAFCAESIRQEATHCKHCHKEQPRSNPTQRPVLTGGW
jgi:hypothetical protein